MMQLAIAARTAVGSESLTLFARQMSIEMTVAIPLTIDSIGVGRNDGANKIYSTTLALRVL